MFDKHGEGSQKNNKTTLSGERHKNAKSDNKRVITDQYSPSEEDKL